ncbi:MAG: glutamate formimidoyltransferase [Candidatus Saganbacteria bacterium]|nr:glutamate formimidoyltransferase [Candidatus Saganbacteria bacterium]
MEKIIESVPNFSVGQNIDCIQPIVNSIRSAGTRIKVADYSYDTDHGRLVVTVFGEGDELCEGIFQGVKKAVQIINFNDHKGVHPCMGAVDVIPFIPIRKATFNDCVKIRDEISRNIADELGIPVYIYGNIARFPERKELSAVRKGGLEGVAERICTPEGKPDFGPAKLHPTAGAVAIGARDILIAFNVDLETDDLQAAKDIAEKIREKNGGLRGVRAIGVPLESKSIVQVAVNIVNYKSSSIKQVFDAVKAEAIKKEIAVLGSEIIGLIPKDATFAGMKEYLKLEEWSSSRIIENYL